MNDHWTSDPGRGCGLAFLLALAFWVAVLHRLEYLGRAAIEAEARRAVLTELRAAVEGLEQRNDWASREENVGKVHNHIGGECGWKATVLALIDERLR